MSISHVSKSLKKNCSPKDLRAFDSHLSQDAGEVGGRGHILIPLDPTQCLVYGGGLLLGRASEDPARIFH